MKKNEGIQRINCLIDRYFDAATTIDEERELRRRLASTTIASPKIDEARAVMGLVAVERKFSRRGRVIPWLQMAGMAASVAVALVLCVGLLSGGGDRDANCCVAYLGASEVNDINDVMSLFDSQLRMIDGAATAFETDMAGQLSVIAEFLTL